MALTDGDRNWMQDRFDSQSERFDAFKEKFEAHRLEDQLISEGLRHTSAALREHLQAESDSRVRKKKSWGFWIGVIVALAAPVIAIMIEHWFFVKHVAEHLSK